MRKLILTFLLLVFTLAGAQAQTISLLADASQLDVGGGNSDFKCVLEASSGLLIGYNQDAEAIVTYDATTSTLGTLRSQADLQSDLSTTGIDACDAATIDGSDNIYMSLRDTNNDSFIYQINADGTAGSISFFPVNGANSLAVMGTTLYVGVVGTFGDVANGLYSVTTPVSGSSTLTVEQNDASMADITLDGTLAVRGNGDVLIMTNEGPFGGAAEPNKIFSVSDPSSAADNASTVTEIADPIASGPLSSADGELLHMEVVAFAGAERIVVVNGSFSAPDGEEIAVIQLDGTATVLATAADIEAATGLSDFAPATDVAFVANAAGDVKIASREGGSFGAYGLVLIESLALPVELATFDGQFTGNGISLSWQTVTETNNAGFELQHRAPNASSFVSAGFVEGSGTTNQVSNYTFFLNTAQSGTHTFRLLQVDVDGDETLSDPITVEVMGEPVVLTGPNPATSGSQVEVLLNMEASQEVNVALYNLLGQKVATIYSGRAEKDRTLRRSVDLSSLASGLYFVRVVGETVSSTKRLSVVR